MTIHIGLSDRLACHVGTLPYAALPARTIEFARYAILDGLGVMLAASGQSADARPFVALALAAGGVREAGLLGRPERVPMQAAAFANGALAHALDYEDAFDAAPSHPNASLLPAAFAVCEGAGGVSGEDLLLAVAMGCDLVCRLALAVRRPLEAGGWYPPPIFGAFGATAAAARLLSLDARTTRDAFSLLLCQNVCPGEIKYSRDTVVRAVREAFPAQAALVSCLLARAGVRGFEQPFEGAGGFFRLFCDGRYDERTLVDGLGSRFWIEQLSFKPWPCCRGTHAFIEAAAALRAEHPFDVQDIVEITLEGSEVHRMLAEPVAQKQAPRTLIDAKFSLPFVVGLALAGEPVTLGGFTSQSLQDGRTLDLAARCRFVSTGRFAGHAAAGGVTLRLADGRKFEHVVEVAAGSPGRPLSQAQLVAKFVDCAARACTPLDPSAAQALAARVLRLEEEADAGALLRAVCPSAG